MLLLTDTKIKQTRSVIIAADFGQKKKSALVIAELNKTPVSKMREK